VSKTWHEGFMKEPKPVPLARWLIAGVILAAIPLCVVTVDRPLTEFLVAHPIPGLSLLVRLPRVFFLLALVVPFFAGRLSKGGGSAAWKDLFFLLSFSVLWSLAVVELALKRLAGRLPPDAWLYRHEYGFHWFFGRLPRFQSFPSGEAALLMAAIGVLWVLYPKARWLYVLAFLVEALALITLRWHFLSDVLAGGLVGACGAALAFRFVGRTTL
jgi:membrane-associated phospholipid phosphatase